MKKKNIRMFAIIMVFVVIAVFATRKNWVKADEATTIEVNTAEQFLEALATIHSDSDKSYIIELGDNIELPESAGTDDKLTIDNGNTVTINGNGNTITFSISSGDMMKVSEAHLYLKGGDGTLTLKGPEAGASEALIKVSNGSVDMYSGVTLSDNHGGTGHFCCGGVRIGNNGTFNMYGGTITDMRIPVTEVGGAAVMVEESNSVFNMTGGELTNNYCVAYGGAMYAAANAKVNITNGIFKNNEAAYGGVLQCQEDAIVTIKNSTFEKNKAQFGGTICMLGGTVTIENSTFKEETASARGGVAYLQEAELNISNSTFEECSATQYGGCIFNYGATVTLNNNTIEKCTAGLWGGVVVNYQGTLSMDGNTIKKCEAGTGGGIYTRGDVTLKNNTFEKNGANNGGVVACITSGDLTSQNNIMKSNEGGNGGAIYSTSTGTITSVGDDISENSAVYGGGVYVVRGAMDFSESNIYNNKAQTAGSDLLIGEDVTSAKLKGAADMDKTADFDDKTVIIKNWYKDEENSRYSLTNFTDVVNTSDITTGTAWLLVGATNTPDEKRFTVKFDANDGTGEMDPQRFEYDVDAQLSANKFSREGYKFAGWNTKADGTGDSYKDKQLVKNLTEVNNGRVILYAQWVEATETDTNDEETIEEIIEGNSAADDVNEEFQEQSNDKVKTGDNIIKWTTILAIATAALALGVKNRKKFAKVKGKRFK